MYIKTLVWNPKADETEAIQVGAKPRLFEPQARPDSAFIKPLHVSFSAVTERDVVWNVWTNVPTNI